VNPDTEVSAAVLHYLEKRNRSTHTEQPNEASVAVPRLSAQVQAAYWRDLLCSTRQAALDDREEFQETARDEFTRADTESDVVALVSRKDPNAVKQQARVQAAVERLASVRVEQTTKYFLEDFAELLEPNPRAMKRLLNAYSVQRDFALLGGLEVVLADVATRKKLVLWTILCMRWPALEDYLIEQAAERKENTMSVLSSLRLEEAPLDLRPLLANNPAEKILNGDGVEVSLDFKSISVLAGIRNPDTRSGGSVA
jgi:hypothetical protein